MENIFVEFLPPWVETGLQPAFYDKESGTVLQQTARMYARVNMLIRMFNKLSKNTKETVEEYIDKFNELHDYVHDYFDNLDVQEEINNKLDAMAEAGTLQEIIGDYLNATAVWGFDTVNDMVNSTNLINGSFARTLGYRVKGDGGGSFYKIRNITNDDVIDGGSIIEMNDAQNQLVAELIPSDRVVPEQFGAYGDGIHDDLTYLNTMEAYCKKTGVTMSGTSSAVYGVSDSFILRTGYATDFNLATIKALNIMQSVVRHQKIRQGDSLTESVTNEYTSNMVIDCDGKADYGFYQDGWCWSTLVENIKVLNPLEIGIYIFKGSVRMFTCRVEQMDKTHHCVGLQVDSVDSEFYTIITRDCSTGICVKGEGNTFNSCHPSLFRPALIDGSKGFELYKFTSLINCVADTYHYGIYLNNNQQGFTAVNFHNLIATEWYDAEGAGTEAPYFIYSTTDTVTYSQKISLFGCWMNEGAVYQGEKTNFSNFTTWSGASIRLNNPRFNISQFDGLMPKEIRQPTSAVDISSYLQINKTANSMSIMINGNTIELIIENLSLTGLTQDVNFDLFADLPTKACPSTARYFLATTTSGVLCRINFTSSKIQIRPISGDVSADDKLWIDHLLVK